MEHSMIGRWRSIFLVAGPVVLLMLMLMLVLGLLWIPAASWQRARARRTWLASQEAEVRRLMQVGRPAPVRPGPDNWFDQNFVLFDQGWAMWRLNSFHSDPDEGGGWGGIGDIVVLIDDQGRAHYSRFHFCDGTLGWALGHPFSPLPTRPANIDAFLALFKPGTWTDDRAAVEAAVPLTSPPR